jgi:hypothetical protein
MSTVTEGLLDAGATATQRERQLAFLHPGAEIIRVAVSVNHFDGTWWCFNSVRAVLTDRNLHISHSSPPEQLQ